MPDGFAPNFKSGQSAIVTSQPIVCVDFSPLVLEDSLLSIPESTGPNRRLLASDNPAYCEAAPDCTGDVNLR